MSEFVVTLASGATSQGDLVIEFLDAPALALEMAPEVALAVQFSAPDTFVVDLPAPPTLALAFPETTELEADLAPFYRGPQGEVGPVGPAGPAVAPLEFPTDSPIGGHRVVRVLGGFAVYANPADLPGANLVIGITTRASATGTTAFVQPDGLMSEASWAWVPDLPIFCGAAGVLTQVVPTSGFSLIVGIAVGPSQIFIGPKAPIIVI